MMEAKKPLKAQLQAELQAAANDDEREAITAAFSSREKVNAFHHDQSTAAWWTHASFY